MMRPRTLRPIHMAILSCENLECANNGAGRCQKIRGHQTRQCGAYTLDFRKTSIPPPLTIDPKFNLKPRRIL